MSTNQVNKNQVMAKPTHKVIEFEKNVSDSVQNRVSELSSQGRLNLPANYSVGNAMASAWLQIQDIMVGGVPATKACTQSSIANALLEMVVMGLNPSKKQCFFIPYGNKLSLYVSYFGKAATVKRLKGIDTEPIATLIYDGDEIELGMNDLGEELVLSHKKTWANKLTGNIVGAYATLMQGEIKRSAVMTMVEIREAWTKNPSKGNNRDHTTFTGEFAKRTVINRLIKMILQTSNDDDLLAETMIANEYQHYDFEEVTVDKAEETAKLEVATNANTGEVIDIPEDFEEENEENILQTPYIPTQQSATEGTRVFAEEVIQEKPKREKPF